MKRIPAKHGLWIGGQKKSTGTVLCTLGYGSTPPVYWLLSRAGINELEVWTAAVACAAITALFDLSRRLDIPTDGRMRTIYNLHLLFHTTSKINDGDNP